MKGCGVKSIRNISVALRKFDQSKKGLNVFWHSMSWGSDGVPGLHLLLLFELGCHLC